jgi:diguanylate cyclase (GGDEF)-like protein
MPKLSTSDLLLRDPVTGVYSRAAGVERLDAAIHEARQGGSGVALLLVHVSFPRSSSAVPEGIRDSATVTFVRRLEEVAGTADRLFKLGPTDFALILAGTSGDKAAGIARRVLKALHAVPLEAGLPFALSLSIGVASFPADAQGQEALIETARRRMREAKKRGPGLLLAQDEVDEKPRPTRLLPSLTLPAEEDAFEGVSGGEGQRYTLGSADSPIIGRKTELADLALSLESARLVTVVGPRGIGKTRLAFEAARMHQEKQGGNALLVPLGEDTIAPDHITTAIASAIGLTFEGPEPSDVQLIGYLRDQQLLIVLDNMPPLINGIALVRDLIDGAPGVQLLATCRQPLGLRTEKVVALGGLGKKHTGSLSPKKAKSKTAHWTVFLTELELAEQPAPIENDAERLFVEVAQQAAHDFSPSPDDLKHIGGICRLLEASPLAIKLVATWVRTRSCEEIADELSRSIEQVRAGSGFDPRSPRSLRAAFDYVWGLLPDARRDTLARLSVFRGGFSERAASRIATVTHTQLASFVEKAFVERSAEGRFSLHPAFRLYAQEQLQANPEREAEVRRRHALYYLGTLRQLEPSLFRAGNASSEAILNEIGAEIWNLRAAWNWASEKAHEESISDALESLCVFYETRGLYVEAERELGSAADGLRRLNEGRGETLGRVLVRQARMSTRLGKYETAGNMLQEALVYLTGIYAPEETARALRGLGEVAYLLGKYDEAVEFVEEARAVCGDLEDISSVWTTNPTLNILDPSSLPH